MTEKQFHKNPCKILQVSNKESRKLTRESLETALLLLLEKKPLIKLRFLNSSLKLAFHVMLSIEITNLRKPFLNLFLTQIVRRYFSRHQKKFRFKDTALPKRGFSY